MKAEAHSGAAFDAHGRAAWGHRPIPIRRCLCDVNWRTPRRQRLVRVEDPGRKRPVYRGRDGDRARRDRCCDLASRARRWAVRRRTKKRSRCEAEIERTKTAIAGGRGHGPCGAGRARKLRPDGMAMSAIAGPVSRHRKARRIQWHERWQAWQSEWARRSNSAVEEHAGDPAHGQVVLELPARERAGCRCSPTLAPCRSPGTMRPRDTIGRRPSRRCCVDGTVAACPVTAPSANRPGGHCSPVPAVSDIPKAAPGRSGRDSPSFAPPTTPEFEEDGGAMNSRNIAAAQTPSRRLGGAFCRAGAVTSYQNIAFSSRKPVPDSIRGWVAVRSGKRVQIKTAEFFLANGAVPDIRCGRFGR